MKSLFNFCMKATHRWVAFKRWVAFTGLLFTTSVLSYGNYTDNNDGSITDNITGLIWQKCSMGQSGTDCSGDAATAATWTAAISYCEGLTLSGRSDWRLPNINELESLVDDSIYNPSINTTYFPGTVSSYYWSASTYVCNTNSAWNVGFNNGYVNSSAKANNYYVRCLSGP